MPVYTSSRNVARIILAVVSLGLSISAGRTILELWQRRDIVEVRERELMRLKQDTIQLEKTLLDMKSESYVERIARDKLGMIKEGEILVMLPMNATLSGEQHTQGVVPTWKKWWSLFF